MSLEAVKEITSLEADLEQEKAEAQAAAKKRIADAAQAGEAKIASSKESAAGQVKEKLAAAQDRAAGVIRQINNDTAQAKSALTDRAEANMSKAVDLIVERVMELS